MIDLNTKKWIWTGRVLSTLGALFMTFDAVVHLSQIPAVTQSFQQMGYSLGVIVPLSIIELVCILLYVFPRTSVFGAILLTGYLGGAVDANVRGSMSLALILAPAIIAAVLWLGLVLRNQNLRQSVFSMRSSRGTKNL